MKTLNRIAFVFAFVCVAAFAQTNTLTQTSLSTAALATDKFINVTSATGINAPAIQSGTVGSELYLVAPGNPRGVTVLVTSVSGTAIGIRPTSGGAMTALPSGSMVLAGQPNWFYGFDPSGGCTQSATFVTPWINTKTGNQWLCSTVTNSWVPGFANDVAPPTPTAAVASAAGLITPSGPLFHVTGTSAITGFTLPVGFAFGSFCVVPDGIFTTTNATNIAIASTAVVSKVDCWTYDPATTKFYPAY
jgi:hypothetical protein